MRLRKISRHNHSRDHPGRPPTGAKQKLRDCRTSCQPKPILFSINNYLDFSGNHDDNRKASRYERLYLSDLRRKPAGDRREFIKGRFLFYEQHTFNISKISGFNLIEIYTGWKLSCIKTCCMISGR